MGRCSPQPSPVPATMPPSGTLLEESNTYIPNSYSKFWNSPLKSQKNESSDTSSRLDWLHLHFPSRSKHAREIKLFSLKSVVWNNLQQCWEEQPFPPLYCESSLKWFRETTELDRRKPSHQKHSNQFVAQTVSSGNCKDLLEEIFNNPFREYLLPLPCTLRSSTPTMQKH